MEKNDKFLTAFSKLGEIPDIPPDLFEDIEAFVCTMHGRPKVSQVNVACYMLFQQHYAPKNKDQPLKKIKGIDPSNLPPCRSVVLQKLLQCGRMQLGNSEF